MHNIYLPHTIFDIKRGLIGLEALGMRSRVESNGSLTKTLLRSNHRTILQTRSQKFSIEMSIFWSSPLG